VRLWSFLMACGRALVAAPLAEPTAHSLYLGNLSYSVDSDELRRLVSRYGEPSLCHVVRASNGASRGFGFVCFHDSTSCQEAIHQLSRTNYNVRELLVRVADLHRMLDWPTCTRIGAQIQTLIDEQDRPRRFDSYMRGPSLRSCVVRLFPHPRLRWAWSRPCSPRL
jgi:RNA recognition motif-containing protein